MSIKEFEDCIKTLDAAIALMKKAVTFVKQLDDTLKTVAGSGNKVAGDLREKAKDKDGSDKNQYLSAASTASVISGQASDLQKKPK
jgi:hypothetical protein